MIDWQKIGEAECPTFIARKMGAGFLLCLGKKSRNYSLAKTLIYLRRGACPVTSP
ncbi:hypothetical protein X726_25715 [Mesorhizobium sp. L103C105A0]|nr:hypothetical protein X726_25715 [Mesorhizobium sp. L103C105A0]